MGFESNGYKFCDSLRTKTIQKNRQSHICDYVELNMGNFFEFDTQNCARIELDNNLLLK